MKTRMISFTLFAFLQLAFTNLQAQGWTKLNPYPTFNHLSAVSFPSADTGYTVGQNSTVLRTTDGGNSWTALDFPEKGEQLRNVSFTSNNKGFIVIGRRVYRTNDAGNTWQMSPLPNYWASADQSYFIDDTTGFVFGWYNAIAKTTNGGVNWQMLAFSIMEDNVIMSMKFANHQTGYLCGQKDLGKTQPMLKRTDDGGITWQEIEVPTWIKCINDLAVISPEEIWIAPGNSPGHIARLYHSVDGGETWTSVTLGENNNSNGVIKLDFFNSLQGRALGNYRMYSTNDGGQTWTNSYTNLYNYEICSQQDIAWINHDTAIYVGYGPLIGKTEDEGLTTENMMIGNIYPLQSVYFIDSLKGVAGGRKTAGVYISYTEDGGYTWNEADVDVPFFQFSYNRIDDIHFRDQLNGWATSYSNVLYKTMDGGQSWNAHPTELPDITFNFIHSFSANNIWGFSKNGKIIRSNDGGSSWTSQTIFNTNSINLRPVFTDSLHGFIAVVSQSSPATHRLMKNTNGGSYWQDIYTCSNGIEILAFHFADSLHGIVSLSDKSLLFTADGGENWEVSEFNPPYFISYIKMFDSQYGLINTKGNFTALTFDGGLTFTAMHSDPNSGWAESSNTFFLKENLGWAVGLQGMIMRYDNFMTSTFQQPDNHLSQLFFFPNPASEKITLRQHDYKMLIIFDIEGRLLYLRRNTGHHQVDVSFLKPGTYILALDTNHGMLKQKLVIIN